MKARYEFLIKSMVPVLAFALCGMPELVEAQQAAPAPLQSQQTGTTVDPSKGPLQPIPTQTQPEEPRTVYPGQEVISRRLRSLQRRLRKPSPNPNRSRWARPLLKE